MASIDNRTSGYRVRSRDPLGQQRSRTFRRKVDADRFAREIEVDNDRGAWIDSRNADTDQAGGFQDVEMVSEQIGLETRLPAQLDRSATGHGCRGSSNDRQPHWIAQGGVPNLAGSMRCAVIVDSGRSWPPTGHVMGEGLTPAHG